MSADPDAVAAYRTALARNGCDVVIKRLRGFAPNVTVVAEAAVRACVQGFSPAPGESYSGQGAIPEGTRRVIVLAPDLAEKDFPLPLIDGDKLVLGAQELDIGDIDAETRHVAGAIAFNVTGVK